MSNTYRAFRPAASLMLLISTLVAVSCGGGGASSTSGNQPPANPPGTPGGDSPPDLVPVVYLADQEVTGRNELFLVQPTGVTKLNAPLPVDGSVEQYQLTPDHSAVIYTADHAVVGRTELYIVPLAQAGNATRLNSPLGANRDVIEFRMSPDGHRVLYRADQDSDGIYELYSVQTSVPGVVSKLNPTLPAGGWVRSGFSFSPDSAKVLYRAEQNAAGRVDLFLLDLAGSTPAQQVNPPLVSGGNIAELFGFTPDGNVIGYVADQDVDGKLELYSVATQTPGVSSKLNGPMIPEGDVCRFIFSPDSSRVAYCADQQVDDVMELYTVALNAAGHSVKMNPPLAAAGSVTTGYAFSPDSSFLVYAAAQDLATATELYRVDVAAPGVATKLNPSLGASRHVTDFEIRADGQRVGYVANQDRIDAYELFERDLQAGNTPVKLSGAMQGLGLYDFHYTNQGTRVVYLANQDNNYAQLYRVDVATPGVTARLNAPLVTGGEVWNYTMAQ